MAKYPHQSPYAAFNNNPIFFADPTGLEGDTTVTGADGNNVALPRKSRDKSEKNSSLQRS